MLTYFDGFLPWQVLRIRVAGYSARVFVLSVFGLLWSHSSMLSMFLSPGCGLVLEFINWLEFFCLSFVFLMRLGLTMNVLFPRAVGFLEIVGFVSIATLLNFKCSFCFY